MKTISPFAQYTLRKLLSLYVRQNSIPIVGQVPVRIENHLDLQKLFDRLYPAAPDSHLKLQELETLLFMEQSVEQGLLSLEYQETVRQRIYRLLRLRLNTILAKQMPPILYEEPSIFRFYYANQVRSGIQYNRHMYGLIYEIDNQQRLQAFKMLWLLAEQNVPAIMTINESRHTIWVDLRSPAYQVMFERGKVLLEKLVMLNVDRQKVKGVDLPKTGHSPLERVVALLPH